MAYDPELVVRVHALLASEPTLEDKAMFGGIAFMVEGKLTVAVMNRGWLLARVGRDAAPRLVGTGVEQMEMGGRPMTGWLRVAPEVIDDDEGLAQWVRRCRDFVRTLA